MWYPKAKWKKIVFATSLTVQWLRLCAYIAGGVGLIPGWGTNIPHAVRCGQKKNHQKTKTVLRLKLRLSNTLYKLNEVTIGLITGFSKEIIGDLDYSSFGEV